MGFLSMNQPNVLLLILDSVRAQNVGHLGHPRNTTPYLDEFGDKATTYTNARTPGIHSISSHVSLFTGYHVAEHQATSHGASIKPGHTVWEELTERGYQTGLFTPNSIVAESSNLASFFDHVEGPEREELRFPDALGPAAVQGDTSYLEYLIACLKSDEPLKSVLNGLYREFGRSTAVHDPKREHGGEYVRKFLEWYDRDDDPWAACINLMDAHYPYLPQDEFVTWSDDKIRALHEEAMGGPLTTQYLGDRPFWELVASEDLYDDCIRQADAYVGKLLSALEESGELEDTLVVLTSDHGEGFGEYSPLNNSVRLIDHSWGISDEVSHVPLVVKHPGQANHETIEAPASLTNFPTVVRSSLEDGDTTDFVAGSTGALTTSYRVEEPGDELPLPESKRDPYLGPWHALCHKVGDDVVVDAMRRSDDVRYFPSRTVSSPSSASGRETIETVVKNLAPVDMTNDSRDINTEVQERLNQLGYV